MPLFTCSNGEVIELPWNVAGMDTGYAFIGNPYFHTNDSCWKISDGDSVIGCSADSPNAMRVQDAYQLWIERCNEEQAMWDEVEYQHNQYIMQREEDAAWEPIERLYEIQDALS